MFLIKLLVTTTLLFNVAAWAEPPNIARLMQRIQTYHDSGEYAKELDGIIARADRFMKQRVALNQQQPHPKPLAIVLDIDETSLSNYDKMSARHYISNPKQLHQDAMDANAPAIKSTLSLYRDAQRLGVSVFFVTGRREAYRVATDKNLIQAGYQGWTGLYFKPEKYNQSSVKPFKSRVRKNIIKQGYQIIATIGDQCSDLIGGYAEQQFKLPNPYYYIP